VIAFASDSFHQRVDTIHVFIRGCFTTLHSAVAALVVRLCEAEPVTYFATPKTTSRKPTLPIFTPKADLTKGNNEDVLEK
jgi:hypothetical protein